MTIMKYISISILTAFIFSGCSKEPAKSANIDSSTEKKHINSEQTTDTPEQIYKNYITTVQTLTQLQDFPAEKFLTKRATEKQRQSFEERGIKFDIGATINDKPLEVTDKKVTIGEKLKDTKAVEEMVLEFWKYDSEIPTNATFEQTKIDDSNLTLTINATDFPKPASVYKADIYFKNENGWKIDKIKTSETIKDEHGSGSVTSTLFE